MFGNWGQVLEIDLSCKTATRVTGIGDDALRRCIGGTCLATELLSGQWSEEVSALAPRSVLVLATGPFQGTSYPGSAKWVAVARSPLTGTVCVSAAGGSFGQQLKRSGFDALSIGGAAPGPSYAIVHDGSFHLRDASEFWGLDSLETIERLRHIHHDLRPSILAIGPAGEKQVAIACIVADGHSFAGRGGLGAVMGSKKLKAIVVSGRERPRLADPAKLSELGRRAADSLREATQDTLNRHGTAGDLTFFESVGDLPIKYWTGDEWSEGAHRIGAPRFTEVLQARPQHCIACPIGCHRRIEYRGGNGRDIVGAGPEYESLGLLGGACLVDDLGALARANDLCNRLGIDTMSAGAFVAFAMLCQEQGLIGARATCGMSLEWGDASSLLALIEQIGLRKGLGEIFAGGIRPAASALGGGTSDLAVEVKGMDLPAHDPRSFFSLALNYATCPQGACHLRGFPHVGEIRMTIPEAGYDCLTERFSMSGKASMVKLFQDYAFLLDSLVDCCFMQISGLSLSETCKALGAITGEEYTAQSALQIGERAFNMQRLMNIQDGLTRDDDRLPGQVLRPASSGPRAGKTPSDGFAEALEEYYLARGWTWEGVPTEEKAAELGLATQRH